MWSRKRIDIDWSDLVFGAIRCGFRNGLDETARRAEQLWPDAERSMACFSVRTGFDLLLRALELPRGSEVLVSALTIPDMARIIERHGLVAVPVDLDTRRMSPSLEQWQQAITPSTRMILTAHLFGSRTDIEPLVAMAHRHRLFVVEDCAQAFAGCNYQGFPQADASMFSFGTIKNCTALGGAVLCVRNRDVLTRMRTIEAAYPRQTNGAYFKRVSKYALLKSLSGRAICGLISRVCRAVGCDYDRWVNHAAKGFPGSDLIEQIRRRPSAALLAVLERRLRRHDPRQRHRHIEKGRRLTAHLQSFVECPGASVEPHSYWVFPIQTDRPEELRTHLARAGFDATQGQSLCVVGPPSDRDNGRAAAAEELLAELLFLPFYPEMPAAEADRMAAVVKAASAL